MSKRCCIIRQHSDLDAGGDVDNPVVVYIRSLTPHHFSQEEKK
jgi:hypothetical protein